MTSEEQLRAALLGGGQLTAWLTSAQRSFGSGLDFQKERGLTIVQSRDYAALASQAEAWMSALKKVDVFESAIHEATKVQRIIDVAHQSMTLRAVEAAQWQTYRQNVFGRLETHFILRGRTEIKRFLDKYFFLTPLLLEARDKITQFFGPANAVLEVSADPENANYEELWVRIQTNELPADALRTLTSFDEEWWLDASASSNDLLNIKLEYV